MQTMRACLDLEWESICKLLTVEEQPHISADMLGCISLTSQHSSCFPYGNNYPSFFCSPETAHISSNAWFNNPETGSQENESSRQSDVEDSTFECFLDFPASSDISLCLDFSMSEETEGCFGLKFLDGERNETISTDDSSVSPLDNERRNNSLIISAPTFEEASLKRKANEPVSENENMCVLEAPKKKTRIRRTAQSRKTKAEPKSEEESARIETVEAESEPRQRSSIRCDNSSEDDCNESEESYQGGDSISNKSSITTSTGKKRASRGEATDPQSLYARRRRMRINERLRILQSLVPNGTKVDISTMLEEGFHYVKFLQLQIRLLSSDDLWMYAPLAYSGFDATVYSRMSPFLGLA